MRDVGRMGEDSFSLLCNSTGLAANRIQVDKTGWDFLVEFPALANESIPLDMREGTFQCKFQTKATDKKVHSVPIALSNLNRLAKDPLPAFICLLCFYSKDTVQDIYCVHIDETIIALTLKTIRKNEAAGKTKLNKTDLNITFPQQSRLPEATGESLVTYISSCIGKSLKGYTKSKLQNLERIGYPTQKHGFSFKLDSREEFEKLENGFLGLPTTINVSDVAGFTNRFDIKLPDAKVNAKKATITIQPNPLNDVLVIFQEDKLTQPIIFQSKLFISPFIKKRKGKVRVVNDFFEFSMNLETQKIDFTNKVEASTDVTIEQLRKWIKLTKIINARDAKLTLRLPAGPAMDLIINANDSFPDFSDEYLLCNKIKNIFKWFDVDEHHKVRLKDVDRDYQLITQLDNIINGISADCKFSFDPNQKASLYEGKVVAGIGRLTFNVFNLFLTLIMSVSGELTISSNGRHVISSEHCTAHHGWFSKSSFVRDSDIEKHVADVVTQFEAKGIAVFRYLPVD